MTTNKNVWDPEDKFLVARNKYGAAVRRKAHESVLSELRSTMWAERLLRDFREYGDFLTTKDRVRVAREVAGGMFDEKAVPLLPGDAAESRRGKPFKVTNVTDDGSVHLADVETGDIKVLSAEQFRKGYRRAE